MWNVLCISDIRVNGFGNIVAGEDVHLDSIVVNGGLSRVQKINDVKSTPYSSEETNVATMTVKPPLPQVRLTKPKAVGIEIVRVGEREPPKDGLWHPEPFKDFTLELNSTGCHDFVWSLQTLESGSLHSCQTRVVLQFGVPGFYQLKIFDSESGSNVHTSTLRNQYVRRELRELTTSEWQDYVNAVWTIKTTSTRDGRRIFGDNCPNGESDYLEYDFFVLLHGFHASDARCDQLHFSMMQEFAHEAWTTMFERALQCVQPSVTLHYWNAILDSDTREHSVVWGSSFYGKSVSDQNTAYVTDGAFAYFPLRQNRTGLCQWMDEVDVERCEQFIQLDFYPWRGRENETGFELVSPRDSNAYSFVSRRTGHLAGLEDDVSAYVFPDDRIIADVSNTSFLNAMRLIASDRIHGFAHYWVSGIWETEANWNPFDQFQETEPEIMADALRLFVWPQDVRGRPDACVSCNSTHCECTETTECGTSVTTPTSAFDVVWTNYSRNSWWFEWLEANRVRTERETFFGCGMLRTGTFDRSSFSNADPSYYLHHSFTFWVIHQAMRNSIDEPPFFNLEKYTEHECPGHRLDDETVFSNIVPYSDGKVIGSRHTWRDILYAWDERRNPSRWE